MGPEFKATPMIRCKSSSGSEKTFFMDGSLSTHGECMLYPGKDVSWPDHLPNYLKGEFVKPITDGEPEPISFEIWKIEYRDGSYWYYDKEGKHYAEEFLEKSEEEKSQELPDILTINGVAYVRLDACDTYRSKNEKEIDN